MELRSCFRWGPMMAMMAMMVLMVLLMVTMGSTMESTLGSTCFGEEMTPEEREDPLVKTLLPAFDNVAVVYNPTMIFLVREDDQSLLFNSLLGMVIQGFRGKGLLLFTKGNPTDFTFAAVKLCNELASIKVFFIAKLREEDKFKRFSQLDPTIAENDKGLILLDMLIEELEQIKISAGSIAASCNSKTQIQITKPTSLLIARLSDQFHPLLLRLTQPHIGAIGIKLHQDNTPLDLYDVIFRFDQIEKKRIVIDQLVDHPTGEGIDFNGAGVRFVSKIYPDIKKIEPTKVILKFTA